MPLHTASPAFGFLVIMWFVMMSSMMVPVIWPWVRAFHRFQNEIRATAEFVLGYFTAWLIYSFAVAFFQMRVGQLGPLWIAAIFAAAGAYQFSPLKQACLMHCRSPFSFFLARWHNRSSRGLRIGWSHGLYCLGCCWALMATSIAVGMANLWWMAVLATVTFIEQVTPRGNKLRIPPGIALLAAAIQNLIHRL